MKSFFRFVLVVLALLVVALVSALTAMRFAIHGREVAVPNLVEKTPSEGFRIAEDNGLQFVVERKFYSPTVPEGKILSQVPEPGVKVRRGWQVRVAQSLGPQRVEIPNVLGESGRAAQINILRRGLDVAAIAVIQLPGAPANEVLAQSPLPNASGVSAPKISLLMADVPQPSAFVMPSFVGQPLGSVSLALQDAGMRIGSVTIAAQSPTAEGQIPANAPNVLPSSIVASQNPSAGQKIAAGSVVNFEVR
jgi:eukaryotic-like serine/threonine-protein kinase